MIAGVAAMPDSSPSPVPIPAERTTRRPFVLVTGLSGAGRATALHALEDLGYVAVDNMPLPLLGDLMRSTAGSRGEMAAPLAFGVDTRTYGFDAAGVWCGACSNCASGPTSRRACSILDCDTETLQRRYTEIAPAASDGARPAGDRRHRRRAPPARPGARFRRLVIDTSALAPHEFSQLLTGHFALAAEPSLRLAVISFSLPPRPAARGGPGVRCPFPEESALRAGIEAADRPRPAGGRLHRHGPDYEPFIEPAARD